IRRPEITRRDDDGACFRPPLLAALCSGHDDEISGASLYRGYPLALGHGNAEVQHASPVIAERVTPARLLGRDSERQSANRQLLCRREESHIGRVRGDRADHDFRVQHQRLEPRVLGRDGGGKATWPRPDDQDINIFRHRAPGWLRDAGGAGWNRPLNADDLIASGADAHVRYWRLDQRLDAIE